MKKSLVTFLSLAVAAGSLIAADPRMAGVPGADDLSRYTAAKAALGQRTVLRDASGRTLGMAATATTVSWTRAA